MLIMVIPKSVNKFKGVLDKTIKLADVVSLILYKPFKPTKITRKRKKLVDEISQLIFIAFK